MTPQEKAVIEAAGVWADNQHQPEAIRNLKIAVDVWTEERERESAAVAGLCNAPSTGGAMRCILPNSHASDGVIVLHQGRTRNGHARRWKEVR